MSIRAKTRTRLIILCLAVVGVIAVGAMGVVALKYRNAARLDANRADGLAAFEAGDYHKTLNELGRVLRSKGAGADPLVTLRWAEARLKIREPGGRHWIEAESWLRDLIAQAPDSEHISAAKEHLLEVYAHQRNKRVEAQRLAEDLISKHDEPKVRWLRVLFEAQIADEKQAAAALETGRRYVELDPTDLDGQQLYFYAIRRNEKRVTLEDGTVLTPDEQIVYHAKQLREKYPDDVHFELLLGQAYGLTGDEEAVKVIKALVDRPLPDAIYGRILASLLDQIAEYALSQRVWVAAAEAFDDEVIDRVAARRLWQSGQSEQVLAMTDDLSLEDDMVPADLLAMRALTLLQLNRGDEMRPIVAALSAREEDAYARAWVSVIELLAAAKGPPQALELIKVAESSLKLAPGEPIFHHYLASANLQLGEYALAAQNWIKICQELSPSWQLPYQLAANAMNMAGQYKETLAAVRVARDRHFDGLALRIEESLAAYALLARGEVNDPPKVREQLLSLVSQIQENVAPGEPRTLPIYVVLLAEDGRKDEAAAAARAAVGGENTLPRGAFVALVALDEQFELGLGDEFKQAYEQSGGATVDVVFQEAMELHGKGQTAQGLKVIDDALARIAPENLEAMLPLEMARVQYLSGVGDERAMDAWRAVTSKYPQSLGVQRAAVYSPVARQDRALAMEAVQRLRKIAGEDAVVWRIGMAMVLVDHGGSAEELSQAIDYLRQTVDSGRGTPDVLVNLSQLYERAGNMSDALGMMQQAYRARPDATLLLFQVGRLQYTMGLYEQAIAALTQALQGSLAANYRRAAAEYLANMGARDAAMKAYEGVYDNLQSNPPADRQLAVLYFQQSNTEQALRVCDKLMGSQQPNDLRIAADLYAAAGHADKAEAAIERLKSLSLEPGHVEFLLAEHYLRRGDQKLAMSQAVAATQANPQNWGAWLLRLGFIVRLADQIEPAAAIEDFTKALAQARAALPADENIAYVADREQMIVDSMTVPFARPLLLTLIEDVARRPVAAEALAEIAKVRADPSKLSSAISTVSQLVNRQQQLLSLRVVLINLLVYSEQIDDAVNEAFAAAGAFPLDPEPAAIAARLSESQGNWPRAIDAGNLWRERMANSDPTAADIFLARMLLNANRFPEAIDRLRPYIREEQGRLVATDEVLNLMMSALTRAGRVADARALLEPHLSESAMVRNGWLYAATHYIQDPKVAIAWLERIEPVVSKDDETERMRLGQAWWRVGTHLSNEQYVTRGKSVLEATADRPGASELPARELAMIAEVEGDLPRAAAWYRRALERRPDDAGTLNNLAMVNLQSDGDLDEAHAMIVKAVEIRPDIAAFWDTRALVERARKDYDAAIRSIGRAITLEPQNPEWQVGLVEAYLAADRTEEATRALRELDVLLRDLLRVPPALQGRVDTVRRALNPPAQ